MHERTKHIQQEVTKLLGMYEAYKVLLEQKQVLGARIAKRTLRGQSDVQDLRRYKECDIQLQELSDSMTFDSPTIWLNYKHEAYKSEAQPIVSMHDLRMHCSKPGYICTKRYDFLNHQLQHFDEPTLDNHTTYPDSFAISIILAEDIFQKLESDDSLMSTWKSYEYYRLDNKPAKWQNFTLV